MNGCGIQKWDAVGLSWENQRQFGAAENQGVYGVPLDHPLRNGQQRFPRLIFDDPQFDLGEELLMDVLLLLR